MDYQVYKKDLLDLGLSLFSRGYATGGSGNMSLKLPDGNILATPTGSSFGRLVADELSVVDMSGNHLWGKKPSKEVAFHLSLYKGNQDCKAVVHLHPRI
jgi:ribulose-5-phosphate 4-epimerase/fuculose-1-phosphate aldolase